MKTETITIAESDSVLLRDLAEETGKPKSVVLSTALRNFRRALLLRASHEAYERLRANEPEWQEELEERKLLDGVLMDGLEE